MGNIYSKIKELRLKAELSQEELAHKIGYADKTSIAKIEAGKIDLPQSKILAFAKLFNVTPSELLEEYEEDENLIRFSNELDAAVKILEDDGYCVSFSDDYYDDILIIKNKANFIVASLHQFELVNRYEQLQIRGFYNSSSYLLGLNEDPKGYTKMYSIPEPGSAHYAFSDVDNRITDIIYNYQRLNSSGKDKAYDYIRDLSENPRYCIQQELQAAHERTDTEMSKELIAHDDDIMKDDNF